MARQTSEEDDELLAELGVEAEPERRSSRTPREERIIAGFEDIQRFVDEHGRAPQHGEDRDIFERLYAVRLDRLREQGDCRALLKQFDRQGLLEGETDKPTVDTNLDDDALLAELGVGAAEEGDITSLRHVRPRAEKAAAEEIGSRTACKDFDTYKPMFLQLQKDLETGAREARVLKKPDELEYDEIRLDEIKQGAWFIVGGQKAYIAEMGEEAKTKYDRRDARLRVIYDNRTEADVLMRSFQRSLYRDLAARVITERSAGPLFESVSVEGDTESGTIYVLRSMSDHPTVVAHRDVIHKIGVTSSKIETRIANAKLDPTFLMADVEVIATYELYNIKRARLEALIHKFFAVTRLDIEIPDRFGNRVRPQEWYLVPLPAIDHVVNKIRDGTITAFEYDPSQASLVLSARKNQ